MLFQETVCVCKGLKNLNKGPNMMIIREYSAKHMMETMALLTLCLFFSLYTYEGTQMTGGNQLESGQLYVAVGRDRFKKLPYSDLLFTKPRGTRRVSG